MIYSGVLILSSIDFIGYQLMEEEEREEEGDK